MDACSAGVVVAGSGTRASTIGWRVRGSLLEAGAIEWALIEGRTL